MKKPLTIGYEDFLKYYRSKDYSESSAKYKADEDYEIFRRYNVARTPKKERTLGTHIVNWVECTLFVAGGLFAAVFGVVWVVQAWQSLSWEAALAITTGAIAVIAGSIFFVMVKDDM